MSMNLERWKDTAQNRDFRNDTNKNWDIIEYGFNNVVKITSDAAFEKVVDAAKIVWLPPVDSFSHLTTTYPNAVEGNTAMTRDTGKVYRFNGVDWVEIQDIDPTAINEVDMRLTRKLADIGLNVKLFGAIGDGIVDDTIALQKAFDYAKFNNLNILIPPGVYLTNELNAQGFTGKITCAGILKAKPNTNIDRILDISFSKNLIVEDATFDMSQDINTTPESKRCGIGLYGRDIKNVKINSTSYINCRVGRPFFIAGTSKIVPNFPEDGSVNVEINSPKIYGIEYPNPDEGCYPVISSDFYQYDDNGMYFFGSNGVRVDNLTVDETVSFPATTKDITINNIYAEYCDRIAVLNVEGITINNFTLKYFYTRGFNLSPTVTNFRVNNGYIHGGDATQLATAYGCKNGVFSNVEVRPYLPIGEKTSLKTYYGCENITYENITGLGNFESNIMFSLVKNITFKNIKIFKNNTTTPNAVKIIPNHGGKSATVYIMDNIKFIDCVLEGNSALNVKLVDGNCKINARGISFTNCELASLNNGSLFSTDSNLTAANGQFIFVNTRFKGNGSANPILNSKLVSHFQGNAGMFVEFVKAVTVSAASTYIEFGNLYYFVDQLGNGSTGYDTFRNPNVTLLRDGIPLPYGIEWFCDGPMSANIMENRIRVKVPNDFIGKNLVLIRSF